MRINDPRAASVDWASYELTNELPKAMYGLPDDVKFCKSCVISNQRPSSAVETKHKSDSKKTAIHFDADGVCDACLTASRKRSIDWELREKELWDLCDKYRKSDGSYDCLVPGSGGKDSFYQSHILKHKFGMNPLTVTWAPHLYTDWGWRNFQRWIHAGFDNHLVTPNGLVHRLLTRLAVDNLFHPFQPFMIGQKCLAPRVAMEQGIELIFYGENEAEYGNPIADNYSAQREEKYFAADKLDETFFGGVSVPELIAEFGLDLADLRPYLPAPREQLAEAKIQVHYLGYYLKWHPQSAYYYAHEHGGFEASPERTAGTYSKYNSIDDKIDDFHYYTTFIKFGIGRATYDAAQEIRSGDITREEGVALIKRFDGEFPERFENEIFDYLSVPADKMAKAASMFARPEFDRTYFDALTNKFRSPHIWQHHNGEWNLRKSCHSV